MVLLLLLVRGWWTWFECQEYGRFLVVGVVILVVVVETGPWLDDSVVE